MPLIEFTDKGLYCRQGNFYIDPWKPVDKAVITHAHSDHARFGSKFYLCQRQTKPLLQLRLGNNNYQSVEWNETVMMNSVKVSLHPAGHIIGSSQIRIEYNDEVWVVSGDYKTEDDGIRGQIIKRNNELFVWSRGEELMTLKFPEYVELKNELPDGTVLDGEIITFTKEEQGEFIPMPFVTLQTRLHWQI
jgi:hypothetical protein